MKRMKGKKNIMTYLLKMILKVMSGFVLVIGSVISVILYMVFWVTGQEEGAVCQEGGVKITPFNMREEMEEGHFDTEGNYHWKNEKEIRDNWLENIDWVKVGLA